MGGIALLLSATLSLGVISACTPEEQENEDDTTTPSATDTQRLKNGNFEFFREMDEEDDDKRAFINSPNDWSFSSGSPSSTTTSGIVRVSDWDKMAKSTYPLILEADRYEKEDDGTVKKDDDGEPVKATSGELTQAAVSNAEAHWEEASVYDRLEFYEFYSVDSKADFALYGDYGYSIDFEDVEYLSEVANDDAHPLLYAEADGRDAEEDSILMIHNRHTSDGVRGTAQHYTSSTTVTLQAGTAASVSVWVRTSELYHYATSTDGEEDIPVEKRAGAYIGITNTVGGSTLDQMQIKNIVTKDAWEQYTVYIHANTYAATTFRIELGLGQGSSDNRYESVDGYAFFDDVRCKILSDAAYSEATEALGENYTCTINDRGDDKIFLAPELEAKTFALDLNASEEFDPLPFADDESEITVSPTKEVSGSKTYYPENIDPSLRDTRNDEGDKSRNNIGRVMTLDEIKNETTNGYLRTIYNKDFADKFPFEADAQNNIVMLLSANGTAYTATVTNSKFTLAPGTRMLLSFFVKTSEIESGLTGASAILVDGENRNPIAAFDTTTVSTTDIEGDTEEETQAGKDIYRGWVRCFFFVENATETEKSFYLELTYGPTAIASTTKTDYGDGYAAFTDFRTCYLTKSQYAYAATGTYAQKVSLTATVKDSSKFDDASANGTQLEDGLAIPVKYNGVLAGSNVLVEGGAKNPGRETLATEYGVYTGLLSSEYAKNYLDLDTAKTDVSNADYLPNKWMTVLNPENVTLPVEAEGNEAERNRIAAAWWKSMFGNADTTADAAYQPLVIVNTGASVQPAYGFFASSATVASNAASRISVRVKLSEGAKATVYLTDVSDIDKTDTSLAPTLPKYTFWYDEKGNIVSMDPDSADYKKEGKILFTLQDNGLYKNAQDDADENFYANLASFDRDDEGHYVTKDGTRAFWHNPDDTDPDTAYAYYDKDSDTDAYGTPVKQLTVDAAYLRYDYSKEAWDTYAASLTVTGTPENAGKWVTLSFYVQTGNSSKTYRLELWAGCREGTAENLTANAENGIPAQGYVMFDRCSTSSSSNYATLRDAAAAAIRDEINETAETKLGEEDLLPATWKDKPLALYYTFTFFDSPDYLRYDKTADTEKLGNPWGSYDQSAREEALMWLFCEDEDGSLLGTAVPSVSLFMSYAENEVTVTPDDLGETDDGSNDSDTTTEADPDGQNIWLYAASILLVAAIAFALLAIAVRKLWSRRPKKAQKDKKPKLTVLTPDTNASKKTEDEPDEE